MCSDILFFSCIQTKRVFDGSQPSNVLHFGRSNDNDRAYNIMKGKISLEKAEVAGTYDHVVSRIHDSCLKLLRGYKIQVRDLPYYGLVFKTGKQYLLLVGGFGESPYLRKRLEDTYGPNGTQIVTVEEPSYV